MTDPFVRVACSLCVVGMILGTGVGRAEAAGEASIPLPEVTLKAFGTLPPAPPAAPSPAVKEEPATLEKAINRKEVLEALGVTLTDSQKSMLDAHHFLVLPKSATKFKDQVRFEGAEPFNWDEMLGMYDEFSGANDPAYRKPENAHLVTPDVMLHTFHKLVENALEHLEKTEIAQTVDDFVRGLHARLVEEAGKAEGDAKAGLQRLAAQMTVPLVILEVARWETPEPTEVSDEPAPPPPDDGDTMQAAYEALGKHKAGLTEGDWQKAEAELRLIWAADAVKPSPLFAHYSKDTSKVADYTQFRPRSHYAKSSILRAYFRVMMYLGRNAWTFETDEGLRDAALLAWAMAEDKGTAGRLLDPWQRVMEVTQFFAGPSDDIAYPSWRAGIHAALGDGPVSPASLVTPEVLGKLRAALGKLERPKILSDAIMDPEVAQKTKGELLESTLGFRVFGQRFTIDAWLLGQLTAGQEKSSKRLPGCPSAAFLPAVFGDATAKGLVAGLLATESPAFSADEAKSVLGEIDTLGASVAKLTDEHWYRSLDAAWLRVLSRLTGAPGAGYPAYMKSAKFPLRQLGSLLGSYTELKHDTLLYAKQNYAEYGDGQEETEPPPVPRGFVEPNMAFWQEFERLVTFYRTGITTRGLIPAEVEEYSLSSRFLEHVKLCSRLAEKTLKGESPTDEEFESLRVTHLSEFAVPYDPVVYEDEQLRSALIADIHTDMAGGRILYEATAQPHFLLALVGTDGTPRLTVGVVFDHREFTDKVGERLTDEEWKKRVYGTPAGLPKSRIDYSSLLGGN